MFFILEEKMNLVYNKFMHNSWFKTTSGTYINKTCSYILSGFNDPTTLDHLLEFELKGQFPVFRIENPTPALHKDFPYLKNRYNLDLWDLCWNSLNLGGLCWLLDKNFPLSHGKVCDIIHQLKNANSQLLALAESEQFKDFILKFTKTIAGQKSFNSPQDQEPISIAYEIASCCPDSVAEALINAYAPECFTDLRLLNSKRLDLALNLYGEKFPLIHNIIKYEKNLLNGPKTISKAMEKKSINFVPMKNYLKPWNKFLVLVQNYSSKHLNLALWSDKRKALLWI